MLRAWMIRGVRSFPISATVFGVAVTVSLAADVVDATRVQMAAKVVAMLAAAGYAVAAGSSVSPRMRWSLGVFLLLWAAVALTQLLGELAPEPARAPLGANGCPTGVDTGSWRTKLRFAQLTETLRFLALMAACYGIRTLPRSTARLSRTGNVIAFSVLAALAVLGFSPLVAAIDDVWVLAVTAPAVLALLAAAALTVVAATRGGKSRSGGRLFAVTALLTGIPAISSVDGLLSDWYQANYTLPGPSVMQSCLFAISTGSPPTPALVFPGWVLSMLFTVAPAALAWVALNLRRSPSAAD